MKQFSCGDVVPGCRAIFRAESQEAVLALVAHHANVDHGIPEVPAALLEQVLSHMQEIPAIA